MTLSPAAKAAELARSLSIFGGGGGHKRGAPSEHSCIGPEISRDTLPNSRNLFSVVLGAEWSGDDREALATSLVAAEK